MTQKEILQATREHFVNDRFATENGMVIDEVGDGTASCSVVLTQRHRNAMGNVMGGAVFTLADFAFAVAADSLHSPTVSISSSIQFLSTAKGTKMIAHAKCIKDGRTSSVIDVDVYDDTGRHIAKYTGTGFKV